MILIPGVEYNQRYIFFLLSRLAETCSLHARKDMLCVKDTIGSSAGGQHNSLSSPLYHPNWLIVLLQRQLPVRYRTWASPSKSSLTWPTEYGRRRRRSLCTAAIDCHKLEIQ